MRGWNVSTKNHILLYDSLVLQFHSMLHTVHYIGVDKLKKLDNDRTIGIDVIDWEYPTNNSLFKTAGTPVHFLAWDFAGQVSILFL